MKTVALVGYEKNLKNYLAALAGMGVRPVVTLSPEKAAFCDGLLLPGGGDIDPALYGAENDGSHDIDRPMDEAQLTALDRFVRAGKPVLGVCKGHQIVNVYFGGSLIQDLAVAAAHRYNGGDSVHPVTNLSGTALAAVYGPGSMVNSAHHQGLGAMGRGLRAISFAPDGTVEAAAHDSLPILGVQFHPERMCFEKARPDTADGTAVFRWLCEKL